MTDKDLLKMYLAGTIAFPPKHQGPASVTVFTEGQRAASVTLIKVEQELSHGVSISRTFFADDVKAIFEPKASADSTDGTWHAGAGKVSRFIEDKLAAASTKNGSQSFTAEIYVREDASSLLETKAGMTAAECAEYYPPMPQERAAVSHYIVENTGCLQTTGGPAGPIGPGPGSYRVAKTGCLQTTGGPGGGGPGGTPPTGP